MSPNENDLEIVYELRWKNRVRNNDDDDRANIMGILDTPDTCADWTTFKSYLAQNSGTSEDIAISYIDSDGEKIQINPDNYKSALEYSREKARKGQKVILELRKNPYHNLFLRKMNRVKSSHSGGTKEKLRCEKHCSKKRTYDTAVIPPQESDQEDEPPKWFTSYMDKFNQNLEGFIINVMDTYMGDPKRVSRTDKKLRKRNLEEDSSDCVDTLAALALEQTVRKPFKTKHHHEHQSYGLKDYKTEKKLMKLEMKTKRLIEKQSLLAARLELKQMEKATKKSTLSAKTTHKRHSFAQTLPEMNRDDKSSKSAEAPKKNVLFDLVSDNVDIAMIEKMDAVPLYRQTQAEFANRNEIITKTWEVKNSGKYPWTDETVLRFTWGSSSLVPIQSIVPVPKLKPGEIGEITVTLKAPDAVGRFESYWHFFHQNVRFGQWLGCVFVIGIPNRYPSVCSGPLFRTSNERAVDLSVKCQRHWRDDNQSANEPKLDLTSEKRSAASTQTSTILKPNEPIEITAEATAKLSPEPPRKCSKFGAPEVSVVRNINEDQSITYNLTLEKPCCFTLDNLETVQKSFTVPPASQEEAAAQPVKATETDVLVENFNNLSMIVHKNNSVSECNDDESDNISVISRTSSVDSSDLGGEFVMLGSSDNGEKNANSDQKLDDSDDEDTSDNNNNTEQMQSSSDQESSKSTSDGQTSFYMMNESCMMKKNTNDDDEFENVVKINEEAVIVSEPSAPATTNEMLLKPEKPECCHQDPNQSSPFTRHGFAHSTFGDPNFGNGPNGPRFPPGWYPPSSPMSHPTWRNGCSVFGNDFAVNDFSRGNEFLTPEGYQRSVPYPDHLYYCRNHSANSNMHGRYCPQSDKQRRFIFTRYGGGYEALIPDQHHPEVDENEASSSRAQNLNHYGCYMESKPLHYGGCTTEQNVPERDEAMSDLLKKPDRPSTSPPVLNTGRNESETRYSYVFDNKVPIPTNEPVRTEENAKEARPNDTSNEAGHILSENFVNGAVNAASSALITACTVFEKLRNVKDEVGEFATTTVPVLINAARSPLAHSSPAPAPTAPSSNASTNGSEHANDTTSNNDLSDIPPPRSLQSCLNILYEMGFYNRNLNLKLLHQYNNDLPMVISKLI